MGTNLLGNAKKFLTNQLEPRGHYLDSEALTELDRVLEEKKTNLDAAIQLKAESERLIEEATGIVQERFLLNSSLNTGEQLKKIREFIDFFLRSIGYSLIAENTSIIDDYIVNGFDEMLVASQQSPFWYIQALQYIKENHGLKGKAAQQTDFYLDYVISALN